jgi:hypothetical protein
MRAVAQGLLIKGTYEEETPTFSSLDQISKQVSKTVFR